MIENSSIIIQNIVYRKRGDIFEALLLKRTEERGGFWNVVNGTLEDGESIDDCRKRELFEEAGIKNVLSWSDEINRFNFDYKGKTMTVMAFTAQVAEDQGIVINNEHTEYKWVGFDEAIEMMKFEDDKNGLRVCRDRVLNKIP